MGEAIDDTMPAARFAEDAFWILAGRQAETRELQDARHGLSQDAARALVLRLVSSPEFGRLRSAWMEGRDAYADARAVEAGLGSIGDDRAFVERAYECVLGRAADDAGLEHYAGALRAGDSRASVVRSLAMSAECDQRLREYLDGTAIPCDTQLCELANPAKWDNEEWLAILQSLGLTGDKLAMHRKPYELTQLVYGCRRLGMLTQESRIVSIGAGHELVLYWLANHARDVVATDLYEGVWQNIQGREGDPDVLAHPEEYAPFPYRRDHLRFMRMDGRRLTFPDASFDIAYSLSSIEHFGGMSGAVETIREMARVLRPGGILALATEYVLEGPAHDETFQPAEFHSLIGQSGLELVQPIDEAVYRRYSYRAVDLYKNPYQTPHMVVRFNDTVFTTVMVFLRKPGT